MRAADAIQIERYFAEVADALGPLAPERRAEILADLRAHLERRRAESGAGLTEILAELGQPEEIAAQAGLDPPARAESGRPLGEGWSLAAIILTVFAWPLGLVIAAVSGRWRLRHLIYAGVTPLVGWTVAIFGGLAARGGMSSEGSSLQCVPTQPVGGAPPLACTRPPVIVPWTALHPFLHALGVGGAVAALVTGLVGGPVVAAIYLQQTDRNPRHSPWLPVATWVVTIGGFLLAGQFAG